MDDIRLIVITGGVCSSLGKGIVAASLARLLADRSITVRNIKCDPYLNIDPGTMRPAEHGEVFVTDDGAEADLDLGTYERYTGVDARRADSVTAGSCYWSVLNDERRGAMLGSTVQAVPHITDAIKSRICAAAAGVDVGIVEVGGTVGDMEITVFLEAIRQLRAERPGRVVNLHLTLVPAVGPNREPKTKPTQHSVAELRRYGLTPDILLARSDDRLEASVLGKIRATSGVPVVVGVEDQPSPYAVVAGLSHSGLDTSVATLLGLGHVGRRDDRWSVAVERIIQPGADWQHLSVAIVGKYLDGHDTYLSVHEAVRHAAAAHGVVAQTSIVDAEQVERDPDSSLARFDAVIVPGGFGDRGVEGKIAATRWCREQQVPFLGICLGLQIAVVEAARASGVDGARSAEWGGDGPAVVVLLDDQGTVVDKGGTMRLGGADARLDPASATARLYGASTVRERHRHRYEVDPAIVEVIDKAGLHPVGVDDERGLVEFVERGDHPYFHATQAHPEFTSRPERPHPLFIGLIEAAAARNQGAD
jgi:CTP synthase